MWAYIARLYYSVPRLRGDIHVHVLAEGRKAFPAMTVLLSNKDEGICMS